MRGYIHQETFFVMLGACTLLIFKSSTKEAYIASIIYSLGLLFLLGTSATYHRINWSPGPRSILKRIDHSAIFILIASIATPVSLLGIPSEPGKELLIIIWSAAFMGVLQSNFWVSAPKYLTVLFYIIMGSLALPYSSVISNSMGSDKLFLLLLGGAFYVVGAAFYAFKKPNLFPGVFGSHELFHFFTIFGIIFHFIVVYQLVN